VCPRIKQGRKRPPPLTTRTSLPALGGYEHLGVLMPGKSATSYSYQSTVSLERRPRQSRSPVWKLSYFVFGIWVCRQNLNAQLDRQINSPPPPTSAFLIFGFPGPLRGTNAPRSRNNVSVGAPNHSKLFPSYGPGITNVPFTEEASHQCFGESTFFPPRPNRFFCFGHKKLRQNNKPLVAKNSNTDAYPL